MTNHDTSPENHQAAGGQDSLLRNSLRANGTFSATSGALLALGAGIAGPWLEIPVWLCAGIGLGLLGFAISVLQNARRGAIDLAEARLTVGLDLAWVAASAVILLAGLAGDNATLAIALVADVVLLFAVLQALGLRRLASA